MNDSRQAARRRYRAIQWRPGRSLSLFLISGLVAIAVTLVFGDPSFSDSAHYTLFLLAFAVMLWITEAVPPFAVGLLIIGFATFAFGTDIFNREPEPIDKYTNTWASPVIFLMLGGFFLADAMRKTGLDAETLRLATRLFGRQPQYVLLGLMVTTAALSMIMSNTATTAMMIAAVTPLLHARGSDDPLTRAMLIGIPAAATVGGMGTIIGSSPNAVAVGALANAGIRVTFLDWMLLGVPLALILCVGFWGALRLRYRFEAVPVEVTPPEVEDVPASHRRIVLATLVVTVGLWLTGTLHGIPTATVTAIPIVVLTVTGVLNSQDMRQLPWDTLMLVAGGLALGIAIVDHGLAEFYLRDLDIGDAVDLSLLLGFALLTVILSNVMSNTATATILIPIAGILLAEEQLPVTMIIALSASTALFLPVSTPPNAIAYSTGMVTAQDFRFGGITIGIAGPLLIAAVITVLL